MPVATTRSSSDGFSPWRSVTVRATPWCTTAAATTRWPDVRGLRLSLPTPYDMPWMTWYLSAHAVPGVESYENGRYACAVRSAEGPDVVSLDFGARPGSVVVTSLCSGRPEHGLIARIRALRDLDTDATEIAAHLSADPALAPAVAVAPGIRVPGALDGWQLLLQTRVGQQISLPPRPPPLTRVLAA